MLLQGSNNLTEAPTLTFVHNEDKHLTHPVLQRLGHRAQLTTEVHVDGEVQVSLQINNKRSHREHEDHTPSAFSAYVVFDVWLHADGAKDLLSALHSQVVL